MKRWISGMLTLSCLAVASGAAAEIIFYELNDFRGQSFVVNRTVNDFFNYGYNDRAASASVRNGTWQVCTDANFRGQCVTLGPGDYPALSTFGLDRRISSVRTADPINAPTSLRGRIVLFEYPGFGGGRTMSLDGDAVDFAQLGFNDRANSAIVEGGTWQLCEHANFRGSCMTLEPGRYHNLVDLAERISSARLVANRPVVTGGPPGPPQARAVLYSQRGFAGRALSVDRPMVRNLNEYGFNDRAQSLRVESGYWIFCSDANFEGECRTFGPGNYPVLPPELYNSVSSGRRISNAYPYRDQPEWNRY